MSFEITTTTTAAPVIAYSASLGAPSGFRIIDMHYKSRKATDTEPAIAKKPSMSTVVRCINILSIEPASLQDAVQDAVNDLQDALVRKLVEQGRTSILFDEADAAAVAVFAAEQATSKRLSSIAITAWFDASIQDALMDKLTAALNIDRDASDLDMTKLINGVQIYRTRFAELAAPKPAINQVDAEKLLRWANESTDKESSIFGSVVAKLNLLTKRVDVELII